MKSKTNKKMKGNIWIGKFFLRRRRKMEKENEVNIEEKYFT